jgi:hypothetical protein
MEKPPGSGGSVCSVARGPALRLDGEGVFEALHALFQVLALAPLRYYAEHFHTEDTVRDMVMLAIGILVWSSTAALAVNYGAIAYARPTGSWGASWDQPSQQVANEVARRQCGQYAADCAVVVQFWNLCAAYATGEGTMDGWGSGDTRAAAEQRALVACQHQGGSCQLQVWACNSQPGVQPGPGNSWVPEPRPRHSCWYSNGSRVPDCRD